MPRGATTALASLPGCVDAQLCHYCLVTVSPPLPFTQTRRARRWWRWRWRRRKARRCRWWATRTCTCLGRLRGRGGRGHSSTRTRTRTTTMCEGVSSLVGRSKRVGWVGSEWDGPWMWMQSTVSGLTTTATVAVTRDRSDPSDRSDRSVMWSVPFPPLSDTDMWRCPARDGEQGGGRCGIDNG